MPSIRLTLNPPLEKIIQELEDNYKTMSRTEILKMAIAEFYNARFASSSKPDKIVRHLKPCRVIDKWLSTKVEPELTKGELEEIFGDWWTENKENLRK